MLIQTKKFILRPYRKSDAVSLAKNINDKGIERNTLTISYPYKLKDANQWLKGVLKDNLKKKPERIHFVIDINKEVAGCVALSKIIYGHKASIGYWLARPYWGQGIMTSAVKIVTDFGFKKLGLKRIDARVFYYNKASMKVLKKSGYKLEGLLKKFGKKDNKFIDEYLFAKVK